MSRAIFACADGVVGSDVDGLEGLEGAHSDTRGSVLDERVSKWAYDGGLYRFELTM